MDFRIIFVSFVALVSTKPRQETDFRKCISPGFQAAFLQVMKWNPCFKCICTEKNVCKIMRETCPNLSCMLQESDPEKCCRRCKGCVVSGRYYSNKETWRSKVDKCTVYQCNEGVVSSVSPKCVTSCSSPIKIAGSCCPLCMGCIYNGSVIANEEQKRFGPCRTCSCEGGKLICQEQTCPKLPCSKQVKTDEECCPKCAQDSSPTYINIKETSCRFKGTILQNGDNYKLDKCTTCSCKNGTLKCTQQRCSHTLNCNAKDIVHSENHCCAVCKNKIYCKYNGRKYQNNEQWFLKGCAVCICRNGRNMCRKQICKKKIKCGKGFTQGARPGSCCLECLPVKKTCIAFGDPHYRTFDGKAFSYQGVCKYTLVKDCSPDRTFHVITRNFAENNNYFSWIKTVVFIYANLTIVLQQNNRVKISGINVRVPFLYYPYIEIKKSKRYLYIFTDRGITIKWDGVNYIEVSLPNTYMNKVCGLCGNFNGNPTDDFKIKNIGIVNNTIHFGDHWKHTSSKSCKMLTRRNTERKVDKRQCIGWRLQHAHRVCTRAFSDRSIFICKWRVNSNRYFQDCITDVCQCASHQLYCECGAIRSYFNQCSQSITTLSWKRKEKCDISCAGGSVYTECGSACKPTCTSLNSVQSCQKKCVSGCQCPVGMVWEKGKCIMSFECPFFLK